MKLLNCLADGLPPVLGNGGRIIQVLKGCGTWLGTSGGRLGWWGSPFHFLTDGRLSMLGGNIPVWTRCGA